MYASTFYILLHLPRLHDFAQGVQAQSLEARCKLARWGWDFIDFNLSITCYSQKQRLNRKGDERGTNERSADAKCQEGQGKGTR